MHLGNHEDTGYTNFSGTPCKAIGSLGAIYSFARSNRVFAEDVLTL